MDNTQAVEKGLTQGVYDLQYDIPGVPKTQQNKRGISVYTTSQLMGYRAKNKWNDWDYASTENSYFFISPEDRIRITQLCTPVLGIVTSRMNRIAGTKFIVTSDKREEDRIYTELKTLHGTYKDFLKSDDIHYIIARAKINAQIRTRLKDALPDLSNFDNALLRWRRSIQNIKVSECDRVYEWLQEPNSNDKWEDFIRKYIYDLMVHGSGAIYKECLNDKIENIYILPGGTVIPVKEKYIGAKTAYIQLVNNEEPQIFYPDELSYSTYIPNSARAYGLIPLEALINKISESMLFDKMSASNSDMTRMPEKMIIINDSNPFGNIDSDLKNEIPIAVAEQKRIEEKLSQPIKGGIMTFSGNSATVIDLSRENLMSYYNGRQKDIREDVALVFNMSNMEVNLTGSEDTSGRSTSDAQGEIDQGKGVVPILKKIENIFNRDILPFRFGEGFILEADKSIDEAEEIKNISAKANSGVYSINEIRLNDLNEEPFDSPECNLPKGVQPPTGEQNNPFFTQSM